MDHRARVYARGLPHTLTFLGSNGVRDRQINGKAARKASRKTRGGCRVGVEHGSARYNRHPHWLSRLRPPDPSSALHTMLTDQITSASDWAGLFRKRAIELGLTHREVDAPCKITGRLFLKNLRWHENSRRRDDRARVRSAENRTAAGGKIGALAFAALEGVEGVIESHDVYDNEGDNDGEAQRIV